MTDTANTLPRVRPVLQGQYAISSDANEVLTSILGSCVATCIFDPVARIGGMNHFLLPGDQGEKSGNLRYGINSMELLINGILMAGARRTNLQAKLFGGAKMFDGSQNVGESNAEFARWFLDNESIPCTSRSLGGNKGRKVRFSPATGAVQQMFIEPTEEVLADIKQKETSMAQKPRPVPLSGAEDVTFF